MSFSDDIPRKPRITMKLKYNLHITKIPTKKKTLFVKNKKNDPRSQKFKLLVHDPEFFTLK